MTSIGNMISGESTILASGSVNLKPSTSTTEWAIHNIYVPVGALCELYRTDGSNSIKIMNLATSLLSYNFHCSSTSYLSIKNNGTSSILIGYDGLLMEV